MLKKYHYVLLLTFLLAIQVPAPAQQKKAATRTPQKKSVAPAVQKSTIRINTAEWQDFDLGDYTFKRRLPLIVKLPATTVLTTETEEESSDDYIIPLNKKLSISVAGMDNEKEPLATDMARIRQVMDMIKKDGFTYKILIKEPEVFLIVVDIKKGRKLHLLTVYVNKPGDKMYYRFNSDTNDGDMHSDTEWIQLARSLKASTVQ